MASFFPFIGMITPTSSTTTTSSSTSTVPSGETVSNSKWECTITSLTGASLEELEDSEKKNLGTLAHAAAEIEFITGQSVVFETEIVYSIDSEQAESHATDQFLKLSGPMLPVPYYKDIVIAFLRKAADRFQTYEFHVYFDLDFNEPKVVSDEPSWLAEIKQAQESEKVYQVAPQFYKSRTWSLTINQAGVNWPEAIIPALAFVGKKNQVFMECEIPINGFFTLTDSYPADTLSFESAVNDLAKYLKILHFPSVGEVQDIVWRDTECFFWSK